MLPPGACRTSRAAARRIVSCRCLCASSLCSQIPHVPAPTFGVFRECLIGVARIEFTTRRRTNHEVQTVNSEGGGERVVERGVKSSLKKAHKP